MGKGGGRPGVVPVFVGNIGFDISEDQIRDIFQEVGPVVAVRFVTAKDTGKAKGYGFVEFPDLATAESAVRNLNGRELAGRQLRVDFAEHPDGSRVVVGTRRGAWACVSLRLWALVSWLSAGHSAAHPHAAPAPRR